MEATAWKEDYSDDGYRYRLQINNVSGRSTGKIHKETIGWRPAGTGWNPKEKCSVLLFSKKFETEKEWLEWAKHFPYKLVELNRKGNPKPTKLGIDALKRKNKKG
jgi:hypothetical protein